MPSTGKGFPYPTGASPNNVPSDIQALAVAVDSALPVGTVVGTTDTQTLTNKTLAVPIVGDLSNAQHAHTSAPSGGLIVLTKMFRDVHTFTPSGPVAVPSGDIAYIPPFIVSLPAGQSAKIAGASHRIHSGTAATWTVSHGPADAGTAVTGLTGIVSTTTTTFTAATAQNTLVDGDAVQLIVTAVSGTPQNMTVSVYLDVTV